jgi:hypothetical protein
MNNLGSENSTIHYRTRYSLPVFKMNSFFGFMAKIYKTLILIGIVVAYYEIKFHRNSFCKKNSLLKSSKFPLNDDFLFGLSNKMNNLLRFGDEYQNFILSLIYHKTKNKTLLLDSQDIGIIEDMNKYKKNSVKFICGKIFNSELIIFCLKCIYFRASITFISCF